MGALIGIPIIVITYMLQIAVVSRLPLLYGTADLLMLVLIAWALQENVKSAWVWTIVAGLVVTATSATPSITMFIIYLIITGMARFIRSNIWQMPIMGLFLTVLLGTVIQHGMIFVALRVFNDTALPLKDSLNLVTLPSILLNLFLALPVYTLIKDLAGWVYPVVEEQA